MKKIFNKLKFILVLYLYFVLFYKFCYAATLTLSGGSSGSPNAKVSINVKGDFTGRVNLSVNNGSVSPSNIWIENSSSNVTVTLGSSGVTTMTAIVQSGASDNIGNIVSVGSKSKTITINVPKAPTTQNTTNNTTIKPSTVTNTTTKSNNVKSQALSNNAFLKEFRLDTPGITPAFNKTTYNYAIAVGEDIGRLKVTAVPEYSKARVDITGNTNLKEGENIITVKVTAEDNKTTKTYKIIVTKSDNPLKSNAYLQNLIISNATLNPEFSKEVLEYNLNEVDANVQKLDISAFPENEKAKVEILGNENFKEGENIVNIKIISENGKIQKTYTLKVNKRKEERVIGKVIENNRSKMQNTKEKETSNLYNVWLTVKENAVVILLYFFIWLEFLQVVYLYEKLKDQEIK